MKNENEYDFTSILESINVGLERIHVVQLIPSLEELDDVEFLETTSKHRKVLNDLGSRHPDLRQAVLGRIRLIQAQIIQLQAGGHTMDEIRDYLKLN